LLAFPFTWSQLISDLAQFSSQGIITLGLLLLIATPVLRVAVSIVTFVVEHDRTYVVITCLVLAILLFSILAWAPGVPGNTPRSLPDPLLRAGAGADFPVSIGAGLLGSLVGLGVVC